MCWSRVQHTEANEQKEFPLIWPSSVKDAHMETVGVEVQDLQKFWKTTSHSERHLRPWWGKESWLNSRKFREDIRRPPRPVGVQWSEPKKQTCKTIMGISARRIAGFRTKLPGAASIFHLKGDTDLKNPLGFWWDFFVLLGVFWGFLCCCFFVS